MNRIETILNDFFLSDWWTIWLKLNFGFSEIASDPNSRCSSSSVWIRFDVFRQDYFRMLQNSQRFDPALDIRIPSIILGDLWKNFLMDWSWIFRDSSRTSMRFFTHIKKPYPEFLEILEQENLILCNKFIIYSRHGSIKFTIQVGNWALIKATKGILTTASGLLSFHTRTVICWR